MFYGPRSSYVPAFCCAAAVGAPAAHRLTRGGLRTWAEAALAAAAVALGVSLAVEATGVYGVFCGCLEAAAGAGAALHSATGRGELTHRTAGAVAAVFLFAGATSLGVEGRSEESLLQRWGSPTPSRARSPRAGQQRRPEPTQTRRSRSP